MCYSVQVSLESSEILASDNLPWTGNSSSYHFLFNKPNTTEMETQEKAFFFFFSYVLLPKYFWFSFVSGEMSP